MSPKRLNDPVNPLAPTIPGAGVAEFEAIGEERLDRCLLDTAGVIVGTDGAARGFWASWVAFQQAEGKKMNPSEKSRPGL